MTLVSAAPVLSELALVVIYHPTTLPSLPKGLFKARMDVSIFLHALPMLQDHPEVAHVNVQRMHVGQAKSEQRGMFCEYLKCVRISVRTGKGSLYL